MIRYDAFTKRFDGRIAVDALTLDIARGSIVALLGPNGSGKTTSLKAAAGLVRPTSGAVLLGEDRRPATDPLARRHCAFLPQRVAFPEALTGREVVDFYRRLRGSDLEAGARALQIAGLNGSSNRAVGAYSGGMVQRLGLAVALLPQTAVLLLDEPTAALDPDGLHALYRVIEERRAGAAILFSSHQLGDVERLADRVAVLAGGRLVALLTVREMAMRLADRGVMHVDVRRKAPDLLDRVRAVSPGAELLGDQVIVPGAASIRAAALDAIRAGGGEIAGITTREGQLEEFYREITEAHP
jgi:Cu-processing system ATP-binding protein